KPNLTPRENIGWTFDAASALADHHNKVSEKHAEPLFISEEGEENPFADTKYEKFADPEIPRLKGGLARFAVNVGTGVGNLANVFLGRPLSRRLDDNEARRRSYRRRED